MAKNLQWSMGIDGDTIVASYDDLKFAVVYVEKKGDMSRYRLCPVVDGYIISTHLLVRYYPNGTSFEEAVRMTEERIATCKLLYCDARMAGYSWKDGSIYIACANGAQTHFRVEYDGMLTDIVVMSDTDYNTGKMFPEYVYVNNAEVNFKTKALA